MEVDITEVRARRDPPRPPEAEDVVDPDDGGGVAVIDLAPFEPIPLVLL